MSSSNQVFSFFLAARALCHRMYNGGLGIARRLRSIFLFFVGNLHTLCGRMIARSVAWTPLFSFSSDQADDITMVVRVSSTMGCSRRVQGSLAVEQYGNTTLFRVLIDGHEVIDGVDGSNQPGDRFQGAVYLPESVQWEPVFKKVKSANTTSIRGRCAFVKFGPNVSGITALQVTLIHSNKNKSFDAKRVSAALEACIANASEAVNMVSNNNNSFHL
ncbi:unknown protein [Seminavis robusta]|uniref:Uncharacterized protein n=1 Tax=Seminavis robusta TaxID=568900 RepID=A0A9N8EAC9_9STRA|nr:unknown protein [Seminavis robusta]|eukprot:Sro806_g205050.1 n/a (217) ;mRNA; f:5654-6304